MSSISMRTMGLLTLARNATTREVNCVLFITMASQWMLREGTTTPKYIISTLSSPSLAHAGFISSLARNAANTQDTRSYCIHMSLVSFAVFADRESDYARRHIRQRAALTNFKNCRLRGLTSLV